MEVKLTTPRVAALGITVFWAAMMGSLVNRELMPTWTSRGAVGYGSLLSPNEVSRQSRMGVYFRGLRIGSVDTLVRRTADQGVELISQMVISLADLNLPLLAELRRVHTSLHARVGADQRLRTFEFIVREPMRVIIKGRVAGDRLKVTTQFPGAPATEREERFDPRVIMANEFSPFLGVHHLHVGKQWQLATFNPLTREMARVTVTVTAKETRTIAGEPQDVFVLTSEYAGVRVKSWVTAQGEVLRQETPYGFSLRREPNPT